MRSTPRLVQFAALLALASGPPARGADCLRAIYFDLGNTLVDQTNPAPYPLFPTAQATIDSLQARGLALGIITNVPAGWDRSDLEALLAQPAFLDEFDILVLSSEAPAAKPDPAIYTHAYDQLALPRPVSRGHRLRRRDDRRDRQHGPESDLGGAGDRHDRNSPLERSAEPDRRRHDRDPRRPAGGRERSLFLPGRRLRIRRRRRLVELRRLPLTALLRTPLPQVRNPGPPAAYLG